MHDDKDLLVQWAAEEFVAAGRAEGAEKRRAHRRQAEFFADLFRGLNELPNTQIPRSLNADGAVAGFLDRAYASRPGQQDGV